MKIKKSILYYDNGNIRDEWWHKEGDDGYYHREEGPAQIIYHKSGGISYEAWLVDDEEHRMDGPACIYYHKDGTIIAEEYYINGENLSKEEWADHPLRQEYLIKEAMKETLE